MTPREWKKSNKSLQNQTKLLLHNISLEEKYSWLKEDSEPDSEEEWS